MRICVIGDELVAGTGDSRALGWVGRVRAHSLFDSTPTILSLPFPGDTTRSMSTRWEGEVVPRMADAGPRGLVIAVGAGDVLAGISPPRSRLNLANTTDRAAALGIPCFVIGPPPLAGADQGALKELSYSCAQVCERRSIPFVNMFTPLSAHDQWFEDMAASRSYSDSGLTLPGQTGYALMAWLVLHQGWFEWTGAQPKEQ